MPNCRPNEPPPQRLWRDLTVWSDITDRDVKQMSHVHFYHAGFPCTPFSKNGQQAGLVDPNGEAFFAI